MIAIGRAFKIISPLELAFIFCIGWMGIVSGQGEIEELERFFAKRAPSLVELFEKFESEGDEEGMEETMELALELRAAFLEAEGVEEKAEVVLELALAENEAAINLIELAHEEAEIDEEEAERRIVALEEKGGALRGRRDDADDEDGEGRVGFDGPVYTPPPADAPADDELLAKVDFDFEKHIAPALERYCFECHDRESAKGDIDLETALTQEPFVRNRLLWENVAERVKAGDMPPEDETQPTGEERQRIRAWLAKDIDGFDYASVRNPGHLLARRLTREEYNRTIRDLVGLDLRPADEFPMDFSGTSGFSNSGNTLYMQTAHLDRYFTAAENIIDAVRAEPVAWAKLTVAGDARTTLSKFVRRAYRRPPSEGEIGDAMGRYRKAKGAGKAHDDALAEALKFALISPQFLLRVEEAATAGEDQPVGSADLASRLSYFLWASTPDDELLAAAAADKLADPAGRRVQIDRMLADSRSRSLGEIFAAEWLGSDDLGPRIRKDPIDNPWCTETLMASMRGETALFFHSLVLANAPVARLIDADFTFLNAELARFYRIGGIEGEHMRRVRLGTGQRGGLFGHASILAVTSFPDRTSPVVRGKWILDTLLGTPPPPPPPDVPEIEVEGGGVRAARTLRKRLEIHRDSKRCAGCHAQIDPLGFALENYAEFGQWRGGIDSHGSLPNGAQFRGPAGLKLALVDSRLDDLGAQVIRKMLAYALGRQLEYFDETAVREMVSKLKPSGYPLREIVMEIANSYPFTTKRLPESRPNQK